MKILNLYAGLGGNRRLWGDGHEVTAVELDVSVALVYADLYPKDAVIFADAHQFLLDHYKEFDFIWSSPPCPSHSSIRQNIDVRFRGSKPVYPDMRLYEEIILLQSNAKCKWVVENVKPYYKPLIEPTKILQRHLFWSNFEIGDRKFTGDKIRSAQIPGLQEKHGIDLSGYKLRNKRQLLRNCTDSELGKFILEEATE